jgi:tetratricopeptide (TPR) repeat protein
MRSPENIVGVQVVGWCVITANVLFLVFNYLFPAVLPQYDVSRFVSLLATPAVFPWDFYKSYLAEQQIAQLAWIWVVILSALGTLRYQQLGRMLFIILNIINLVLFSAVVLTKLSYGHLVFLKYFFRLYFSAVVSGAYIGFLTIAEVRARFTPTKDLSFLKEWWQRFNMPVAVSSDAKSYYHLALAYRRLGREIDEYQSLQKALAIAPNNAEYHFVLGEFYLRQRRWAEAVEICQAGLKHDPIHLKTCLTLGQAYLRQGCAKEAVSTFTKAVHINDHDPVVFTHLGEAQFRAGQIAEAVESLNKVVEIGPANARVYALLGNIYLEHLADYPQAAQMLQKALRLDPQLPGGDYLLGLSYLKAGRFKEAIRSFKNLLQKNPENKDGHYQLGFSYAMIEDYDSARREYRFLKEIDADLAKTLELVIKK